MLSRNVGALLAHTAGPTLHQLPSDLNVFAKLESKPALVAWRSACNAAGAALCRCVFKHACESCCLLKLRNTLCSYVHMDSWTVKAVHLKPQRNTSECLLQDVLLQQCPVPISMPVT